MNDSSTCGFDMCERPVKVKGLCHPHYKQSWKGQELKPLRASKGNRASCSFTGCTNVAKGRGLCPAHYTQFTKLGMEGLTPLYLTKRRDGDAWERDAEGNKLCIRCSTWKHLDNFTISRSCADGLNSWCSDCKKEDGMTREQRTMRRREVRFNITHDQFLAMLEKQGNGCAICCTQDPGGHGWCLDHDHSCCNTSARSCGKCVRAVLCTRCNSALGLVLENKETLMAMAVYIDTHKRVDDK